MLNRADKYIHLLVGFALLFYVLPGAAEPVDLDDITMSIIEDEDDIDYIIFLPGRDVDWDKMLELNGITQQEYESRYEIFIEGQNESQFEELDFLENDPDTLNSTEILEEE